ncbi:MAG: hypothetical protein DMD67_04275 [Gemmatimonadetes bacterium]|nr:MAG: hypothetical protein DMD67_04275 [Gemmatimonadota bacterium]
MQASPQGLQVGAFDWEDAGWAVPGVDLAQAVDPSCHISASPDLATYWAVVRERWPHCDQADIERLATCGAVWRALAAITWEAHHLARPWADAFIPNLRLYEAELTRPGEPPFRGPGPGRMRALRIGFLFKRPYRAGFVSVFPKAMQALAEAGVVVDVIACNERLIDLSTVRVEHDLYVLRQISGVSMSLAGALHAQGAAIVNPYPVTVALRDKVIAARILEADGAPVPATYVVSQPDLLAPLLNRGPLVLKPYDGTCGSGVHVVRNEADLLAEPRLPNKPPILAQRYHPPQGRDLKIYVIGERLFGVRKVFPARTEAEKYGEPFTPTAEQADIALRCGRAFGIDLYGVDLIESDGQTYVVDMSSIPGFKGVPDAPLHLASYFRAAAERAANGRPVFEPPVAVSP